MKKFFFSLALVLSVIASPVLADQIGLSQPVPRMVVKQYTASNTLVVPNDVSVVTINKLCGSGGSGGGGQASASTAGGGGGGAGNVLGPFNLAVTPGSTLTITIGATAASVAAGADGNFGAVSTITGGLSAVPTEAYGGNPGLKGAAGVGGAGGNGTGFGQGNGGAAGTGGSWATAAFPGLGGAGGGGGGNTGGAAGDGGGTQLYPGGTKGTGNGAGGTGGSSGLGVGGTGGAAGVAGSAPAAGNYCSGGGGGGSNAASGAGGSGYAEIQYWSSL